MAQAIFSKPPHEAESGEPPAHKRAGRRSPLGRRVLKQMAELAGVTVGPGGILLVRGSGAPAPVFSAPEAAPGGLTARAHRAAEHAVYLTDILSHPADGRPRSDLACVPAVGERLFFHSSLCTAKDFRHPTFQRWRVVLGEGPRIHRKIWEHVFIAAHLEAAGLLQDGKRGLGFGVGQEPLPAAFAAQGATIVATDMSADAQTAAGWVATQQHASRREDLNLKGLCPADLFDRRVSFEVCDMNSIPGHFSGFDFCWSSCSLEHLGSIEAGIAFIKASIRTLKPGGIAVHTTEYNVSSNDATIDNDPNLVLFRRMDIERVAAELSADGHRVSDVSFDLLTEPIDLFVDTPPFASDTHIRLALASFVSTSIGLVIQRGH